ncbi:Uncharacterized protein GBIM_14404, partial [Gryllus bimaculatus]
HGNVTCGSPLHGAACSGGAGAASAAEGEGEEGCDVGGGRRVAEGAEFSLGDPCTRCRCEAGGVATCRAAACPPQGNCSHGVLLPRTCCLDCTKCDYQGQLYQEMEVFQPKGEPCKNCLCLKGNVICQNPCIPPPKPLRVGETLNERP